MSDFKKNLSIKEILKPLKILEWARVKMNIDLNIANA